MKLSKSQQISIRVVMLFTVAILSTFIGDNLHDFFGDWKCKGSGQWIKEQYIYENCNHSLSHFHESTWHLGYRHWLYFLMCITLFIIQLVDIITFADKKK